MPLDLGSLRSQPIADLVQTARAHNIENASSLRKPDLVAAILRENGAASTGGGVLETLPDGFGFLRAVEYAFLPGPDDIYVSPSQIRRFNLRTGDVVEGQIRAPKENERYFALIKVEGVNGLAPEAARDKILFENLRATWPNRPLDVGRDDDAARLCASYCPLAYGQRGLVLGAARTGRTAMLRSIGRGIARNHPDVTLFVALIGARPEEVSELERAIDGIHVATTFDEPDARHVQVADMVVERAKRLVEQRRDVVVLLDSLSVLARASHAVVPPAGREIGGLDAAALHRIRRLFGAARAVEEGGSLALLATLDDAGSPADHALYTELRVASNLEIHLDRQLAAGGVWPAMNLAASGTSREELFVPAPRLAALHALRDAARGSVEAALELDRSAAAGQ